MLLDEDSQAKYLVNLLQVASHDVVTVNAVNLTNHPDSIVLDYARTSDRVLLTRPIERWSKKSLHPTAS